MTHFRLIALWRRHIHLLVVIVALRLAVSVTWVAQAFASASIFAALLESLSTAADPRDFGLPALVLVLALLARPALVLLAHLVAHNAMTKVKRELRVRALRILVRTSAADPRGRSGRDHALVVDGIENLDGYLSGYVPQIIVTLVSTAAIGAVMITLSPLAGVVAALVALSVPLIPRLWGRLLARRGGDQWEAYQELQAEFVDSMNGMTTLVAFGAEVRREQQLAEASATLLRRTVAQLRLSLLDSGLAALALVGAPAAVLLALTLQGSAVQPIVVFGLVLLSIELVRPLRDLASLWHAGYVGTFSGTALMGLLENEPDITSDAADAPSRVRRIDLRDIELRHTASEAVALEIPYLQFTSGMTAIVGASGAGKSTLGELIVGLAVPQSGSVAVDGTLFSSDLRLRTVSLVPQDPALFGGTVADEIARGAEGVAASEVATAARDAGIGVEDRSLSLSSPVGEGGLLLSGGQRQRVAIARALVQHRAVLVLDEATSALDPASEAALIERLRGDPDRLLIVITHRTGVARLADRIITVDSGRVVSAHDTNAVVASS